jgi:RNA polymerase sigma-70 factor, ECF subfamily
MSLFGNNGIIPLKGLNLQANTLNMSTSSKYHATAEQMSAEQVQVEAAKKDPNFFGPIYNKYYKQIFGYVYQRMDDKESAFDVTAQVFLKALTNLHKYEFKGVPFASWLYRIAQSEVYQMFRDKKAKRTINVDVGDLRFLFEEIEENYYEDYTPRVLKLIKELPEDDLKLIEMRFFEKRQFKEIAEILEITENNAKVRLYRILERIKKTITSKPSSPNNGVRNKSK